MAELVVQKPGRGLDLVVKIPPMLPRTVTQLLPNIYRCWSGTRSPEGLRGNQVVSGAVGRDSDMRLKEARGAAEVPLR